MIYINGTASISPQPTLGNHEFLTEIKNYQTNMLQCIEPDYSTFFHPNALRRISRVLKMGWAGAKTCLTNAGVKSPDSICVGTGKGCYKNTQLFLFSVYENDEQFVPPSPFIQSAHGSIAAQIAIQTGCKNYNMTYAHRSFSFESAMLDAEMLLKEGKYKNVLIGGVDEIEEIQFKTFDRIGHYKNASTQNLELLSNQSKGTIAGEGSTFFLVEQKISDNTLAGVQAVFTFSNPNNTDAIDLQIKSFLHRENLTVNDLDLVILGLNGDISFDRIYRELMESLFSANCQAYYKHLCGEYHTSSAFALWLAANTIHQKRIPDIIKLNCKEPKSLKKVLIYNQYRNANHSLILLSNR